MNEYTKSWAILIVMMLAVTVIFVMLAMTWETKPRDPCVAYSVPLFVNKIVIMMPQPINKEACKRSKKQKGAHE